MSLSLPSWHHEGTQRAEPRGRGQRASVGATGRRPLPAAAKSLCCRESCRRPLSSGPRVPSYKIRVGGGENGEQRQSSGLGSLASAQGTVTHAGPLRTAHHSCLSPLSSPPTSKTLWADCLSHCLIGAIAWRTGLCAQFLCTLEANLFGS